VSTSSNIRPEPHEPPSAQPQKPPLQTQPTSIDHLRKFAEGGYLYAIMDSSDSNEVTAKAKELGEQRAVSLFQGTAEEQYWSVAPYLIAVDPAVLDWIVTQRWNTPWGLFILSKVDFQILRQHFRRFLIVQLPDSEKWFFRFYDPRITKVYLLNCNEQELRKFFGPARAFGIPDEQDMVWLVQAPPPLPGKGDTDPGAAFLWQIRPEQYHAFEQKAVQDMQDRLIAHLWKSFPEQCQMLGEERTRETVQYGIQRAASYEIVAEADICKYVDLMFGFGRDFDQDARLPWAHDILTDPNVATASEKAQQLYQTAMALIRQAVEAAKTAE
jgi:hypothetical protein